MKVGARRSAVILTLRGDDALPRSGPFSHAPSCATMRPAARMEKRTTTLKIVTKRIYETASEEDGFRVLVDRIWPRGLKKEKAAIDLWAKDVAPSTDLRKWFHHDPDRWEEFERRYRAELKECRPALEDLLKRAGRHRLTLLFAAREQEQNQATVLAEVLAEMKGS